MPDRRGAWVLGAVLLLHAAGAPSAGPPPGTWDAAVRERGADPVAIPDPFRLDEASRDLARQLAGTGDSVSRLRRLQTALFRKPLGPFRYERQETYTASEALARRAGNCVSFTSLFIALGREAGIKVVPALIHRPHEVEHDGDLAVVNTHVVAAHRTPAGVVLFDFSLSRDAPLPQVRLVDDLWMAAIHLNNRAVTHLRAGELEQARELLERAVPLAPGFGGMQANLGVVYRRLGLLDAALDAYLVALTAEPGLRAAQADLMVLYRLRRSVDPLPTGALADGDRAMADGAFREAEKHYRLAVREGPGRAEPLVALARAQLALGDLRRARRTLDRGRALGPGDTEADRLAALLARPGLKGELQPIRFVHPVVADPYPHAD